MADVSFFNTEQFMPHGMCYQWQTDILMTSVISDVATAAAYYSITAAFIYFVKKRSDILYPWFFILAGSIIFAACGTSHLISAIVIWEPIYGISAITKAVTAVSSMATGVLIWYVLPFFLRLPSPSKLEEKNQALQTSLNKFQQAQHQLIESEKLASLGNMVAGVAHELNTPIGIGITSTTYAQQLIAKAKDKDLNSLEMYELVESIGESCDLTLKNLAIGRDLINRFKEVAAVENTKFSYTFDLKIYIEDILTTLLNKYQVDGNTVEFNCPDNLMIKINPNSALHIISNLVDNSIKHAFTGSQTGKINITINQTQDHSLEILYTDNGKGMDVKEVENIFTPFYTNSRGKGNSGLGMTIVYNTIKSLKGNISCQSTLNEGTHFAITLPYHPSKEAPKSGGWSTTKLLVRLSIIYKLLHKLLLPLQHMTF